MSNKATEVGLQVNGLLDKAFIENHQQLTNYPALINLLSHEDINEFFMKNKDVAEACQRLLMHGNFTQLQELLVNKSVQALFCQQKNVYQLLQVLLDLPDRSLLLQWAASEKIKALVRAGKLTTATLLQDCQQGEQQLYACITEEDNHALLMAGRLSLAFVRQHHTSPILARYKAALTEAMTQYFDTGELTAEFLMKHADATHFERFASDCQNQRIHVLVRNGYCNFKSLAALAKYESIDAYNDYIEQSTALANAIQQALQFFQQGLRKRWQAKHYPRWCLAMKAALSVLQKEPRLSSKLENCFTFALTNLIATDDLPETDDSLHCLATLLLAWEYLHYFSPEVGVDKSKVSFDQKNRQRDFVELITIFSKNFTESELAEHLAEHLKATQSKRWLGRTNLLLWKGTQTYLDIRQCIEKAYQEHGQPAMQTAAIWLQAAIVKLGETEQDVFVTKLLKNNPINSQEIANVVTMDDFDPEHECVVYN